MVINRWRTNGISNEVKLIQNINKNPQGFLGIHSVQKEASFPWTVIIMHMRNGILSNWKKVISDIEIAIIDWFFQFCFTWGTNIRWTWFKKRFSTNKIRTKISKIGKAKLNLCGLQTLDYMAISLSHKIRKKSEGQVVSWWNSYSWRNF